MSNWQFIHSPHVDDAMCDVPQCVRVARWAMIGESGDLLMCDEHHARAISGGEDGPSRSGP